MTDQVEFRPTPGRDAMTRDGRRVRKLAQIPWGVWALRGVIDGEPTYHEWRAEMTGPSRPATNSFWSDGNATSLGCST